MPRSIAAAGSPQAAAGLRLQQNRFRQADNEGKHGNMGTAHLRRVCCPRGGKFLTGMLEPGQYAIIAEAYPGPEGQRKMGVPKFGMPRPAFVGRAVVTVREAGPPPQVTIELRERKIERQPAAVPAGGQRPSEPSPKPKAS